MRRKKNVLIQICIIDEVLNYLQDEHKLLRDKLNNPTFIVQSKFKHCFNWMPKGNINNVITKIIELCIALWSIEELFDLKDKQATFLDIVTAISNLFGVSIKNPHKLKSQTLSRNATSGLLHELTDAYQQEVNATLKRKG